MLRPFLSMTIIIFYITGFALAANPSKIIGYLPEYRIEAIDDSVGKYLTDLIFFSLEPTTAGTLDDSRFTLDVQNKLSQIKNEYDIRIHVALGGWERSSGFAAMATNDSLRADFIEELTNFCQEYEFDGVDYDWEFPQNENENNAYTALIVDTKEAFQEHDLVVTCALNVSQHLKFNAYVALDHIHIMSYDHDGQHATYNQAVSDITTFIFRGIVPEKLYLGVPFYGRHITNRTAYTYSEIIATYNPLPEVDQVDEIYFNGINTIKKKTEYAINNNLGGIMIWEVGQDTRDETSLLVAIKETFELMSEITDSQENLPGKYLLYQNYPNPFNPKTVISWQLAVSTDVKLNVYNLLGQKVAMLVSERQQPGRYKIEWDASGMASGVYYYRLVAGPNVVTKKLVLLK